MVIEMAISSMPFLIFGLICIIISGSSLYFTVGKLIEIKKSLWSRILLWIACTVALNMIIFLSDWANLPPSFVFFLVTIFVCCEGSGLKKLAIGTMIASAVFSFSALLDDFSTMELLKYKPMFRAFFALVLYWTVRLFRPERDSELTPGMWKLLLLLNLTPIGIVLTLVLGTTETQRFLAEEIGQNNYLSVAQNAQEKQYIVLLLLALFSFVGLLWTTVVLSRQRKLEQQSMYAEMNQRYYESMEQQHFEIRRMRHDMVNHLQTLSVLPEKEKEEYIQNLLDNTVNIRNSHYCGDSTINAVLTVKAAAMEELEIEFSYKLDIPTELALNKMDICALFANTLDNAIEACKHLPEEKRMIALESRMQKGMFVLSVKNPVSEDAMLIQDEKQKGVFLTTKSDYKNHGIGLKSIEDVVRRNDGKMEIHVQERIFEVFLFVYI